MYVLALLTSLTTALAGPTGPFQIAELEWDECIEVACHQSAHYPPIVTAQSYLGTFTHRGPGPRPISITDMCVATHGVGAQGLLVQLWQTPGITSGACIIDPPDPTDPTDTNPPSFDEALEALEEFEKEMDDLYGN
jgi:hypothetical protein